MQSNKFPEDLKKAVRNKIVQKTTQFLILGTIYSLAVFLFGKFILHTEKEKKDLASFKHKASYDYLGDARAVHGHRLHLRIYSVSQSALRRKLHPRKYASDHRDLVYVRDEMGLYCFGLLCGNSDCARPDDGKGLGDSAALHAVGRGLYGPRRGDLDPFA